MREFALRAALVARCHLRAGVPQDYNPMEDPDPDSWPTGSPFTPDAPSPFSPAAQGEHPLAAPFSLEALRPSSDQAPASNTVDITNMGAHNRAATANGHADAISNADLG